MNPIKLLRETDSVPVAIACGKCGHLFALVGDAEQWAVECCDKELQKQRQAGKWAEADRRAAERAANARRVSESEYNGPLYWDDGKGHQDGYFRDGDELREWCESNDESVPESVWGCNTVRFALPSAGELIEDAVSNGEYHENIEDSLGDTDALDVAIKAWNEEQTAESWFQADFRVVLLQEESTSAGRQSDA